MIPLLLSELKIQLDSWLLPKCEYHLWYLHENLAMVITVTVDGCCIYKVYLIFSLFQKLALYSQSLWKVEHRIDLAFKLDSDEII